MRDNLSADNRLPPDRDADNRAGEDRGEGERCEVVEDALDPACAKDSRCVAEVAVCALDRREDREEYRPDNRGHGEEDNHLIGVAEHVDKDRDKREGGEVLEDIEEREEEVGEGAPTDEERDRDPEDKRDAVGNDETVGGPEHGVAKRDEGYVLKVVQEPYKECCTDNAGHDYPHASVPEQVCALPRAREGSCNAANHAPILARL